MAKREQVAEDAFRDWCSERGFFCLKMAIPGFNGMPDRMVLGPGPLIVFIEFKRKGKVPSKLQEKIHDKLVTWGFPVLRKCITKDEAVEFTNNVRREVQATRLPRGRH